MMSRSLQVPGSEFIGVDHEEMRAFLHLLRHKRPLQSGRKSRSTPTPQPRFLENIDDCFRTFFENCLCAVPRSALSRRIESPILKTVEVGENAVLVGEHLFPGSGFCGRLG